MKDLLEDLAVDENDGGAGWMSLEELERELAHLDKEPSLTPTPLTRTAASLVVQQQRQSGVSEDNITATAGINNPAVDAWSLSFQKFATSSLDAAAFLQADSARKQQQQQKSPPPQVGLPPGIDFSSVQDYNVDEQARIAPPPGLPKKRQTSVEPPKGEEHATLELAAQQLWKQFPGDETKDTISALPVTEEAAAAIRNIPRPVPATPQNSIGLVPHPSATAHNSVTLQPGGPTPVSIPPLPTGVVPPGPMPPMQGIVAMSTPGMMPPPPTGQPMVHPPMMAIPVAVPVQGGPAWQQQPPQATVPQQHTRRPTYCNPHPRAPPVPAVQLASAYMSPRDIGYVVHGILRHITAAGASTVDDYDVQYWVRRNGKQAEAAVVNQGKINESNLDERQKAIQGKAKEWSTKNSTLGYVAKSHVSRPRALISQPIKDDDTEEGKENEDDESAQQQRTTLWKSRIYIDQAHQALFAVLNIWKTAPPGQVPPTLQPHLLRLLKCMGINRNGDTSVTEEQCGQQTSPTVYSIVEPSALRLLLTLDKGKVVVGRILENALLPPNAVLVALPAMFKALLGPSSGKSNKKTSTTPPEDTPADARIFASLARIVSSLPQLTADVLVETVEVILKAPPHSWASASRLPTIHAVLQRGTMMSQDPAAPADFVTKWQKYEQEFLKLLEAGI